LGKNQAKEHPWQVLMLTAIARTFGEDLLDALFPGERNTSYLTPMGCFDGFDTIINDNITASKIKTALGNYRAKTGTIAAPADNTETNAYDYILDWFLGANIKLREAQTRLLLPYGMADAFDKAYFNKFKYKPESDIYGRTVLPGSAGKCLLVRSPVMGTGQRMILTVPGNLDFGMNTLGDEDFVQVRTPFEDPNEIQFWIQGDYGCRIQSIHPKVFMVSDGTNASNPLSGDYVS